MSIVNFTQSVTVTDNRGSISLGAFNVSGVSVSVVRYNDGAVQSEGNIPGIIGYYIDITGAIDPNVSALLLNTSLRASGITASDSSIRIMSGYPFFQGTYGSSTYRYVIAFDMTNSVDDQYGGKQATYARSWSITISGSVEIPDVFGCTDPNATNYNSSATVDDGSCTYAPPTVSLSASPTTIVQGNCVTLSWSASGVGLSSATLTDVSNPSYSGSATVCPSNTKTYSYTACGTGGCSTVVRTVTVYIPPVFTLTADDTEITAGLCTTLRWTTTGDANNLTWLSGGLSNLNLNSNSTVCPSDSTTYFGRVSGLGGEDSDDVTVTVHQIPTGSISVPETLLYGQQGIVEYQTQYANLSINLKIYFRNNVETTLAYDYDFPVASSTQLIAPDSSTIRNGDTNINVIYDDLGPRYIDYVFTFSGSGGSSTTTSTTTVIIDETPDNVILEETEGRFNSEEPVYTPNITPDEIIESDLYLIEGIDIPVELKSNKPIQVDINKSNDWQNIREI